MALVGATLALLSHVAGIACAVTAVLARRSAPGAIAWSIALVALPYVAVPLYVLLGRTRFEGYVALRRAGDSELGDLLRPLARSAEPFIVQPALHGGNARALQSLARMPWTRRNGVELLIDGDATFDALFRAIDEAERSIVAEFFILRDDELGRAFLGKLAAKARDGVTVRLLFDDIGSRELPSSALTELRAAGGKACAFNESWGRRRRFQINFRNHRKIVVVDGKVGFVGGHNVGDEYLGRGKRGPWRDTHLRLAGPAATALQLAFLEDWYWAYDETPELPWEITPCPDDGDALALILASGPADEVETAGLAFLHLLTAAESRVWIASPYFVPDDAVMGGLRLAALRGADVRLLVPRKSDSVLVNYASESYLADLAGSGVKAYAYDAGFLHQKIVLVDGVAAMVGTANLDYRSIHLNFEISALLADESFASQIEEMLEADFARSARLDLEHLAARPWTQRLLPRLARLASPVL